MKKNIQPLKKRFSLILIALLLMSVLLSFTSIAPVSADSLKMSFTASNDGSSVIQAAHPSASSTVSARFLTLEMTPDDFGITTIQLNLAKVGSPICDLAVGIYTAINWEPSVSLENSTDVEASSLGTSPGWVNFTFTGDTILETDGVYCFVLFTKDVTTIDGSNYVRIYGNWPLATGSDSGYYINNDWSLSGIGLNPYLYQIYGNKAYQVTISTAPAGVPIQVDGTNYTSSHIFSWASGSEHTLSTWSPQTVNETRYTTTGWSSTEQGSLGTGNITYTMAAINDQITASFSSEYFITVTNTGTGSTTPTGGAWYGAGTNITLSTTATYPYYFVNWSSTSPTNLAINSPTSSSTWVLAGIGGTVTANLEVPHYYITVSTNTGGSTSVSSGFYDSGSIYPIVATPTNASYVFHAWTTSGGVTITDLTNSTTTFTATANGTITATFIPAPYNTDITGILWSVLEFGLGFLCVVIGLALIFKASKVWFVGVISLILGYFLTIMAASSWLMIVVYVGEIVLVIVLLILKGGRKTGDNSK